MTHPRMLNSTDSVLVIVDVQEAYRDQTFTHARMVRQVRRLLDAATVMGVPVLVTEQYPKGLGHTQPEVADGFAPGQAVFAKLAMSSCGAPGFVAALAALGRRQVVLCGIEAHACINQTAHDLLDGGYQVHLPVDAVSARAEQDYRIGCEKMTGSGVVPATVELVCFEWIRTAEAPEFKALQRLIK